METITNPTKIKIINDSGMAFGTKIYIDEKEINNCIDCQISISARDSDPNNNFVAAKLTLIVTEVDIVCKNVDVIMEGK